MDYIKKDLRQDIIASFERTIIKIEANIDGYMYLCHEVDDNDALDLVHKEKPTKTKHVKFFKHPSFMDGLSWWACGDRLTEGTKGNEQRIKFLKMLINKIKKQK